MMPLTSPVGVAPLRPAHRFGNGIPTKLPVAEMKRHDLIEELDERTSAFGQVVLLTPAQKFNDDQLRALVDYARKSDAPCVFNDADRAQWRETHPQVMVRLDERGQFTLNAFKALGCSTSTCGLFRTAGEAFQFIVSCLADNLKRAGGTK